MDSRKRFNAEQPSQPAKKQRKAQASLLPTPLLEKDISTPYKATIAAARLYDGVPAEYLHFYTNGRLIDLGIGRLVFVQNYNKQEYIAIRDYVCDNATQLYRPTTRGISLSIPQWQKLKEGTYKLNAWLEEEDTANKENIDEKANTDTKNEGNGKASIDGYTNGKHIELGQERVACVNNYQGRKYVVLRDYFMYKHTSNGQLSSTCFLTKRGINLTEEQWSNLKAQFEEIDSWITKEQQQQSKKEIKSQYIPATTTKKDEETKPESKPEDKPESKPEQEDDDDYGFESQWY